MNTGFRRQVLARRALLSSAAALALLGFAHGSASAQDAYPSRQITVVMPYAAGGPTDVAARVIVRRMAEDLKQPMVVENKPGGGAMLGAQSVARARPDGYTLLAAVLASLVTNPLLQVKPPYDPNTAFEPISMMSANPLVLVASKSSGIRSFQDFVAKAKAEPGKLTVASYGQGTPSHLAIELLKASAGIDVIHVPYNGSAPAMLDVRGGRVAAMMDILPSQVKTLETGDVVGLALGQKTRSSLVPSVPTFGEVGVAAFEALTWFGLVAPAGTPKAIVDRLNESVRVALKDPATVQALNTMGMEPRWTTPQEYRDTVRADHAKWSAVIRRANIELQQ